MSFSFLLLPLFALIRDASDLTDFNKMYRSMRIINIVVALVADHQSIVNKNLLSKLRKMAQCSNKRKEFLNVVQRKKIKLYSMKEN